DRLPCRGGGACQPHTGAARRVGGPSARGDRARAADRRVPLPTSEAAGLGLLSGAARLHQGRLQCPGPGAWFPAHGVGLRAPLDGGGSSVTCQYRCLVCQRLTPLVSRWNPPIVLTAEEQKSAARA